MLVFATFITTILAKESLTCQIESDRNGTFCNFVNIDGDRRKTSTIITKPIKYQGGIFDRNFVRSIKFERSVFNNFPNEIFTYFPTVWDLKFNTGRLVVIKRGNFKNAGDVRNVEFFNTQIDGLLSKGFEGASTLLEISFRKCDIGLISNNAFDGIPHLKRIKITGSRFNVDKMSRAIPRSVEMVIMPY